MEARQFRLMSGVPPKRFFHVIRRIIIYRWIFSSHLNVDIRSAMILRPRKLASGIRGLHGRLGI